VGPVGQHRVFIGVRTEAIDVVSAKKNNAWDGSALANGMENGLQALVAKPENSGIDRPLGPATVLTTEVSANPVRFSDIRQPLWVAQAVLEQYRHLPAGFLRQSLKSQTAIDTPNCKLGVDGADFAYMRDHEFSAWQSVVVAPNPPQLDAQVFEKFFTGARANFGFRRCICHNGYGERGAQRCAVIEARIGTGTVAVVVDLQIKVDSCWVRTRVILTATASDRNGTAR
jgi:hypothetical protein